LDKKKEIGIDPREFELAEETLTLKASFNYKWTPILHK